MTLEDFIISAHCLIDGFSKQLLGNERLRKRGFQPCLTDSEVITMEIIGKFFCRQLFVMNENEFPGEHGFQQIIVPSISESIFTGQG